MAERNSLSATFTFPSYVFNWYPGNSTSIGFANGTSNSYDTKAVVETATWSENITDGEAFFQYYCVKPAADAAAAASSSSQSSSSGSQTSPPIPAVTGIFQHPPAVVQDPFEVVSGYYLNGTGYEDVAVLWVAQFLSMIDPTNSAQIETLQNVTRDFLADAVATGKKRLVLDVSGNIGGISNSPIEIVRSRISNLTSFSDLLPFTDSNAITSSTASSHQRVPRWKCT